MTSGQRRHCRWRAIFFAAATMLAPHPRVSWRRKFLDAHDLSSRCGLQLAAVERRCSRTGCGHIAQTFRQEMQGTVAKSEGLQGSYCVEYILPVGARVAAALQNVTQ